MKGRQSFLKTLPSKIRHIVKSNHTYDSFNLYFQDESRFGLKTHTGRCITIKGIKPKVSYQHKFENTYLYGSYSPVNGDSFVYEIQGVSTAIFEAYIHEFSKYKPEEFKIIVIDNAGFHSTKKMTIPNNIAFINIPPYTPELNPCERMWHYIKSKFKNQNYNSIEKLQEWLHLQVKSMNPDQIKSIVHNKFYLDIFNSSI